MRGPIRKALCMVVLLPTGTPLTLPPFARNLHEIPGSSGNRGRDRVHRGSPLPRGVTMNAQTLRWTLLPACLAIFVLVLLLGRTAPGGADGAASEKAAPAADGTPR